MSDAAPSRRTPPDAPPPTWRPVEAARFGPDGGFERRLCGVAEEVPVGLRYHGYAHAVMMATPADLEDFALGFSVTEGLAATPRDVLGVEVGRLGDTVEVDVRLTPAGLSAFLRNRRRRSMEGRVGCGLCGVEEASQAVRAAPRVADGRPVAPGALRAALAALEERQRLRKATRAVHGAGWARPDGTLLLMREDVGRHNALDKLIGGALRDGTDLTDGFCVVTSRCSYEMVQKAVAVRMPILVAVSAPTALAIRKAEEAGLTLVAEARGDAHTVYAGRERIVMPDLDEEISS